MHQTVKILGDDSIYVGSNMLPFIAEETCRELRASSYIIVTDTNVAKLHLEQVKKQFIKFLNSDQRLLVYLVPPGEINKTRKTKELLEDYFLLQKCTRDSCVIALGGGVIGDLVGFTAATFMRGVPVVQIPTTLLAMVDSSVGGKTAIDTPHGKNLIGAFHQPKHIQFLKTLPKREFVNGLAEVIKTAATFRENDFEMLENYSSTILQLVGGSSDSDGEKLLLKVILGSVEVKAHVVTVDEKETGVRGLLNFGHSVGHAIEAILYPEMLHGECVSIGMVKEAEISRHLGIANNVTVGRLVRCLQSYGLPVSLEDKIVLERCPHKHCSVDSLMDFMKLDKKNQGNKKRIVLISSIGKVHEPRCSFVNDEVISLILSPSVQIGPTIPSKDIIKLNVPGSKSISNRALVFAALGKGPCRLRGLLHSDDVQVMLDALQKLVGITFEWENEGETLFITGGGGKLRVTDKEIYLGNAGTASRFLTSVCALIRQPLTTGINSTVITGNPRMKQRPIGPLVEALSCNGSKISFLEKEGCLPLKIEALGMKGGLINLSASISSQYVSSILISAPYADEAVTLDLTGSAVISQPYIDMTVSMMKSFGIEVKRVDGTNKYLIPQGVYQNPPEYLIEADASSATYPLAYAAITGATVSVQNMGKKSLQGDSEFAIKVLMEMGCIVEQTDTTTTVTGPYILKPLPTIDMESMTDAFMTATVLASVAQGGDNITCITGIANQRVKECDRIAAMIEQLARFGVTASELPDGIKIHGKPRSQIKVPNPNGINCYDDHRIAMSFSVLACALPLGCNTIITEKKCVEKTWPSWWDTLTNSLGVSLMGIDEHIPPQVHVDKTPENSLSIIIIGMRGAGKTHMGRLAATHLGYQFCDMDQILEKHTGLTIPQYLEKHSWEEFRTIEVHLLSESLLNHPESTVIACGGGIIETEGGRLVLKSWKGQVIHISRSIESIEDYFNVDKTRPSYGEDVRSTWNRRRPFYQKCSTLEYVYISPPVSWDVAEANFTKFLDFSFQRVKLVVPPLQNSSYFLSLTYPNIASVIEIIGNISQGANAIELRVDLLQSFQLEFVGHQIALLRSVSDLPIVFTVRSISQGGSFPDSDFDSMIELLLYAFKWGCEYVDVEFTEPFSRFDILKKLKRQSLLVASYHDCGGEANWSSESSDNGVDMFKKYRELYYHGDIIKLIGKAHSIGDNFNVTKFVDEVRTDKPIIAMLMGPLGKLSRCLNTFLVPVTHPLIPIPAAPGQLSISQINIIRESIGLIEKREYFLAGDPISTSMSPILHNQGFKELGLPHQYELLETNDWKQVLDNIMKPSVYGASITIPLKVSVLQNCVVSEKLSVSARAIGAVNTLIKLEDGSIVGDNTDWIGIKNCILKRGIKKDAVGVVLGAGGTARAAIYALKQLEVSSIRIWNRTIEKAKALGEEFGCETVKDLNLLLQGQNQFVIVGCIPSTAQQSLNFSEMFMNVNNGIIVEMAYIPRQTPLLIAALGFEKVEGIEVLLEQGYAQFEIWTGHQASRIAIKERVMGAY